MRMRVMRNRTLNSEVKDVVGVTGKTLYNMLSGGCL
jgi:hypothetical protein